MFACLSFILGIGLGSFLPAPFSGRPVWWFFGLAAAAVAAVLGWRLKIFRTAALVWLFVFFGLWRYEIGQPQFTPADSAYYNGEKAVITGVVADEPDRRDTNMKLEIASESISVGAGLDLPLRGDGSDSLPVKGKVLVTTHLYPPYRYGDELRLECDLAAPEAFDGFAYDRYLARYDIYSVCYYPEIAKTGEGRGNFFYAAVFRLKDKLRLAIDRGLAEPRSSLARAILLGDKKGLPAELRTAFARSGLSHITAISGLHISIVAALVMSALLGLGLARRWAFYIASAFLCGYIILIGLPASALRAGLMGFLVLYALHCGRLNKMVNSLVFAAALLLMFNPLLLKNDIGFQLSFLAVAGIVYVYPLLKSLAAGLKFSAAGPAGKTADIFALTLAAQVFTWPIIAYNFSQISVIAPLANLFALWTLPLFITAGVGALILGALAPVLAGPLFLPAGLLLSYIIAVGERTAGLPGSYVAAGSIHPGWLILYYAVAAAGIIFMNRRAGARRDLRPEFASGRTEF